jgi:trehalose synthase-fused probable maltokinase
MFDDPSFREWLQNRRWFFERGVEIRSIAQTWRHRILDDAGDVDLTILTVQFATGSASHYFLPIDVNTNREAIGSPVFTGWLLASLNDDSLTGSDLQWSRIGTGVPASAIGLTGKALGVEQSNTSIRYGDEVIIKVNRRLTIGPSPESELLPVISRASDRSFAPDSFGTLWQTGALDAPTCLAICTQYIPNLGDGWSFVKELATEAPEKCVGEAAEMGDLTARMHMGLISDPWRAEVSPEPIRASDTARWTSGALVELDRLVANVAHHMDTFDVEARALAELLPAVVPTLRDRLSGFSALAGTSQIRIHGDYHLGQVLRKPNGQYVVVDFDGEPNRPLSERRGKYSALRDVAGMTRSFSYLRGTLERGAGSSRPRSEWIAWEDSLREAFLTSYLSKLDTGDLTLVPVAPEDFRNALTALELEKAIYECGYEMATRPDWLWLPLNRLVRSR